MAETIGIVQRLTVLSSTSACVWIGPTLNNSELLMVTNDSSAPSIAFAANLVQVLAAAATNYRTVAATHGDSAAAITSIRIDPV